MYRSSRLLALALVAVLGVLAAPRPAQALGGLATITVVDRDTGAALPTYYHRGEYWVAGSPGARYAVEIHNRAGGRLLAVTSVDGVNVLSGQTAAWSQSGYVFDPGDDYQITGWRKSNAEVAAFTFTAAGDSYAARTARPANVGVIGVALFRELEAQTSASVSLPVPQRLQSTADEARASGQRRESANIDLPVAAASAPYTAKLGTGHGEREYSYARDVEFRRARAVPDEVVRIRYDSLDNLIAMGVIRLPRQRSDLPEPFPQSPQRQFVPDPPG